MQLKITKQNDFMVLNVSGEFTAKDLQPMREGIMKMLKAGKNKLVLELSNADDLSHDVIREVCHLNLFARELAGEIVITGLKPKTKEKLSTFSVPRLINSYDSMDAAIKQLTSPKLEPDAVDQGAAGAGGAAALEKEAKMMAEIDTLKQQVKDLKTQLQTKESSGDLANLKKENERFKSHNKNLEAKLLELVIQRREPFDVQASQQQIKDLEGHIERLMTQAAAQATPPKAGGGTPPPAAAK